METITPSLPDPAPSLGGRIRQARRHRDFSQSALGEAVGRDRSTVINWEKGHTRVTVDELVAVAHACSIDPCWFLEGPITAGYSVLPTAA